MGSLGTPSVAALTTITFIATITVLTFGLVTQCHPVLDTVLDSVLGHHAMLSHSAFLTHHLFTCQGSRAPDQGRCRKMGLRPHSVTFIFPFGPAHPPLCHVVNPLSSSYASLLYHIFPHPRLSFVTFPLHHS